ncbi:MAG: tannase/feruloyl esterase family alpha/beta hydrolase [Gammaproteobacteria bacterium]
MLETWHERGEAPDELLGRNPDTGLTRPLCPYPQTAVYDGSGELKDASNWSCEAFEE